MSRVRLFNLKDRIANINKCLSWSSSEANGIVQKKYNFDPYATAPRQLYLRITEECNYRCKQCHIWKHKDPEDSLTTEEKLDLIKQFHALNNKGVVWLTGGEPLKKMEEFLKISLLSRELGLYVGSNTNASYIVDETTAEIILKEGPNFLVISLDSHIKEIHNYTRGIETSYDQVLRAVDLLIKTRNERFSRHINHIRLECILFEETLPLFKEYVEFCRKLGVDSVSFQVLSNTFAIQNKEKDVFYEKHSFKDKGLAKDFLDEIYSNYKNDKFVSIMDIGLIKDSLDNPNFESPAPVCESHERNIIVAINGDIQLCFNSHHILKEPFIGNVRERSLRDLWVSVEAKKARIAMDKCRLSCGMLHCHRKASKMSLLKLSMLMKFIGFRKKLGSLH